MRKTKHVILVMVDLYVLRSTVDVKANVHRARHSEHVSIAARGKAWAHRELSTVLYTCDELNQVACR